MSRARKLLLGGGLGLIGIGVVLYALLIGFTRTTELRDGAVLVQSIGPFGPIGSNASVIEGRDTSLLVDTMLRPLAWKLAGVVEERGLEPGYVVNTHWHPDHTGGNERFSSGARILTHGNTAERMGTPQKAWGLTAPDSFHEFDANDPAARPNERLLEETSIELGELEVRVIPVAQGHTDGDLMLWIPSLDLLFVGDMIWPGAFPHVDVYNGGSVSGLRAALARVRPLIGPETVIVPGHGPPIGTEVFDAYLAMLDGSLSWAERADDSAPFPDGLGGWESPLVPLAVWQAMLEGRVYGMR